MVGFELAKRALGWYLSTVPTYAIIYGAFATVPILLIWVFVSWSIFLVGAVIAAYAPSLKLGMLRYADVAGAAFQLALGILRLLAHSRSSEQRGLPVEELSKQLHIDPLQIGPILNRLIGLDWVARLDEAESPRYVLICEPEKTLAAPLIAAFLLEPAGEVMGLWRQARFDKIKLQMILSD
jgi:membrane protein